MAAATGDWPDGRPSLGGGARFAGGLTVILAPARAASRPVISCADHHQACAQLAAAARSGWPGAAIVVPASASLAAQPPPAATMRAARLVRAALVTVTVR